MKKGEIYEGIIEKVDFPNKGYVNIDGEKVIVKNGIPGQKVRFMINKKRFREVHGRNYLRRNSYRKRGGRKCLKI